MRTKKRKMEKIRTKDETAWCPKCGDSLWVLEILDNEGYVEKHEYECRGCNIIFELTEKSHNSQIKNNSQHGKDDEAVATNMPRLADISDKPQKTNSEGKNEIKKTN